MHIHKTDNISTKRNSSLMTKNEPSFKMIINSQLEKDAFKFAEKTDSSYIEFTKKKFKILKNTVSDNFTLVLKKYENGHNDKLSSMTLSLELHETNGDKLIGEPLIKKTLDEIPNDKKMREESWNMLTKLQPEDIKRTIPRKP